MDLAWLTRSRFLKLQLVTATGSLTFIGVLVDGVVPTVLNAIGPPAGTYGNTNELDITVTFSEAVTVTGTPTIPLTIGGQVRSANYNIGDSTPTVLVFRYTISFNERCLRQWHL